MYALNLVAVRFMTKQNSIWSKTSIIVFNLTSRSSIYIKLASTSKKLTFTEEFQGSKFLLSTFSSGKFATCYY